MLICHEKNCTCFNHQIFNCLQKRLNDEAKSLLQKLDNIFQLTDTFGLTLLHYSVKYGNAEMTQNLIGEGCNVDAQDNFGVTPLMLAVKAKDLKTSRILLKHNADIYATDSSGVCSLRLALRTRCCSPLRPLKQKSHDILEMLFDKVNNDFSKGRLTQFLLNANDELKLAVVVFGNPKVTKFVLDNGYPIDFHEPQRGYTALHCAIMYVRLENAKMLIEHGANVDVLDKDGISPLRYYALHLEDVDANSVVLKMLIENLGCLSVIDYSVDVEELLFFGKERTIRTLLSSGVQLDTCFSDENISHLSLLVANKNIDNLDFLAEFGIQLDVNRRNKAGITALMDAAFHGCPRKVDFLLQHGADVNSTCWILGHSALSCVNYRDSPRNPEAASNAARVIELLLQRGADAQAFLVNRPRFLDHFSASSRVIVAHLAMIEGSLTGSSRNAIESNLRSKDYFDLCRRQLEEMKDFKVHGAVTLLKLLTEREDKLVAYLRNEELLGAFDDAIGNMTRLEPYYLNSLQKRICRGHEVAKLQRKAATSVEALTGLGTDVYHAIVYGIISYLDHQDLCNLCKIEFIFK